MSWQAQEPIHKRHKHVGNVQCELSSVRAVHHRTHEEKELPYLEALPPTETATRTIDSHACFAENPANTTRMTTRPTPQARVKGEERR